MSDKRRDKRFRREHRKRSAARQERTKDAGSGDRLRIVYSPKTNAERERRKTRMDALIGTPFVRLPGATDDKATAFVAKNGTPVPFGGVEMVFNDALLMDAISNWGEDGPLTYDTYEDDIHREVYNWAQEAYKGVEIPEKLRRPRPN